MLVIERIIVSLIIEIGDIIRSEGLSLLHELSKHCTEIFALLSSHLGGLLLLSVNAII